MTVNAGPYKSSMLDALNSAKRWKSAQKRIFEETRTPLERMQMSLMKLRQAYEKGRIGVDLYNRSVMHTRAAYAATLPTLQLATTMTTRLAAAQTYLASQFAMVGSMASMYLGPLAIAYGGFRMAGMAEDFGQAMNSSLAIMKGVTAEIRVAMKEAAYDVAARTKFSMKEAADAYYYLASAGLDAKRSLAAMPVSANFATAGMFDMARATDILTDVVSAMGLSVKDATKYMENMVYVSDILVSAAANANATVEEFGDAMMNRGAVAVRLCNKEMEQGVAILMALADQGFAKGAKAGQQLFMILRDLKKVALQNAEAFKELNIEVFKGTRASDEMHDFVDIIRDLEGAVAGMGARGLQSTLMKLDFPMKSVAGVMALIGKSKDMERYLEILREAKGMTEEVANKQLTEFTKGLREMKAAIENLAIDKLTGPMSDLGTMLKDVIRLQKQVTRGFADVGDNLPDWMKFAMDSPYAELAKPGFVPRSARVGPMMDIYRQMKDLILLSDLVSGETAEDKLAEIDRLVSHQKEVFKMATEEMTRLNDTEQDILSKWEERTQAAKDEASGISEIDKAVRDLKAQYEEAGETWNVLAEDRLRAQWKLTEAAEAEAEAFKKQQQAIKDAAAEQEKLNKAFDDQIAKLEEVIAMHGKSAVEQQRAKMGALLPADDPFKWEAMNEKLVKRQAQLDADAGLQEFDKMFKATRTPFETLQKQLGDLEGWIEAKGFGVAGAGDVIGRMAQKHLETYLKQGGDAAYKPTAALIAGSQQAYSAMVKWQQGGAADPKVKLQERANELLDELPIIRGLLEEQEDVGAWEAPP